MGVGAEQKDMYRADHTVNARSLNALVLLALVAGCAGAGRNEPARQQGAVEEGIASHYAARFGGRRTASGEAYRPGALTAAHRTLPLGTRVRVTRINAKGSGVAGPVEVRINDRGPYSAGRIIDLSAEAARRLGMLGGIARVRVEVIEKPR